MATLFLRPGSADYNIQPSSAVGQGWLIICQWDMYRWGRATVQAARANGAEIINYCLPTHDYGARTTGWNTSAGISMATWGFSQQIQFYGTSRSTGVSNGWYWDKASPWRATVPNYTGWLMDVRGSVSGGTAWMRHVVAVILSWKNDPNWQLDGVMLDVSGDTYTAGATSGLSAAEKADLHAGHRLLHQMLRTALGPNFIIQANDYVSTTNPWINGILLENHRAYDGPGSGMDLSMQRCTHPKRRHMAFVATGAQANTFLNTLCTHVTLGTDTANVSPIPGSSVATGPWPADALHIQGYNSVTDTGGQPPPSLTPPVNTTIPVISGSALVGSLLSSSTGTWTGNPTPTFSYQWRRGGSAITGATSATYLLVSADAGTTITCTVTGANSQGSASATSLAVGPITTPPVLSAPVNTALPVISGTTIVGSTLTCSIGTWTGNPGPTFAYQWKRGGSAIGGATSATYLLVAADVGALISCTVTGTNSQGSASASAVAVGPISELRIFSPPVNTSVPIISGTLIVGNTLSCTSGTWTGNPFPTFTYQWFRNDASIAGAVASTYLLVPADAGTLISCTVTGTNSEGVASGTSADVGPIAAGSGSDVTPPLAPTAIEVDLDFAGSGADVLLVTLPYDPDRSTATGAGLKIYRKPTAWSAGQGSAAGVLTFTMTGSTAASQPAFPLAAINLPAGTHYLKGFTYDTSGNEQTGGPSTSYTVSGAAPWLYSAGFTPVQMTEGGGGGEPGTAPPWLYSGGFVAQQVPEEEGGGNGGNGGGNGGNGGGNGGEPVIPPVASNARLLVGSAGVPAHPTRDDAA